MIITGGVAGVAGIAGVAGVVGVAGTAGVAGVAGLAAATGVGVLDTTGVADGVGVATAVDEPPPPPPPPLPPLDPVVAAVVDEHVPEGVVVIATDTPARSLTEWVILDSFVSQIVAISRVLVRVRFDASRIVTEFPGSSVSVNLFVTTSNVENVPPLSSVNELLSAGKTIVKFCVRSAANVAKGTTSNEAETPRRIERIRFIV